MWRIRSDVKWEDSPPPLRHYPWFCATTHDVICSSDIIARDGIVTHTQKYREKCRTDGMDVVPSEANSDKYFPILCDW
jgi:hypothetical protein